MPPQVVVRAADARPFDLQDLLPSDARFKILIFAGDLEDHARLTALESLVGRATSENGFLRKYGVRGLGKSWDEVFEVLTVLVGRKDEIEYTVVPEVLRPHWSKYVRFDGLPCFLAQILFQGYLLTIWILPVSMEEMPTKALVYLVRVQSSWSVRMAMLGRSLPSMVLSILTTILRDL